MTLVLLFVRIPPSERFVSFIEWLNPRNYFACGGGDCDLRGHLETLEKEGCLLLYHPHGIFSQGFSWSGAWSPKLKKHAGSISFFIDKNLRSRNPLFKIICDLHGNIQNLSSTSIEGFMSRRKNVAWIPGGFADATVMKFGCERTVTSTKLLLVSIRYGLKHAYKLYPVYNFGESDAYHTLTGKTKFRLKLNSRGVPCLAFLGFLPCPLLSRTNVLMYSYVGRPVQLPRIEQPTKEDIAHWKEQYLKALQDTFDEFKHDAGCSDRQLEMLDVQKTFGVDV